MENASKALIISAEILIGVLLLMLLVFLFRTFGGVSNSINENIETNKLNEFNTKFEVYNGRKDLTAQDIITIGNLAKQYNASEGAGMTITVIVTGVDSKYSNIHKLNDEQSYEFINKYSVENQVKFECQNIDYNENTKMTHKIILKRL